MAKANWIQEAVSKNPGALTKTAKKEGGETKKGTIKKSFLKEAKEGDFGPKAKKRANLASTLRGFKKK